MARRTLASFETLWEIHEKSYMEVFTLALEELPEQYPSSSDEDAISEELSLILNQICFRIWKQKCVELSVPDWEKPISPKAKDELRGGKIRKRPDFSCKFINPHAVSEKEFEISLHVECKRIGSPSSVSWIFNENYVIHGIKRFDCSDHGYGNRAPSGLMIGYIVSMTPMEIESEVNRYQQKHLPHCPEIKFDSYLAMLLQTHQIIQRRYLKPKQFKLIHLWVDLINKNFLGFNEETLLKLP